MRFNSIPAPYSIYQGICQLPPGCILELRGVEDCCAQPQPYWSFAEIAAAGQADPFVGSEQEAIDGLESRLREAVGLRLVADVPLGAFLSGGIDSSVVVALMQAQSDRPVRTFSIGYENLDYNEAEYARAVAQHLGTDHTNLYVTPQDVLDTVPLLPQIYDEPFADWSQIPTYLLSILTRRHVTVSLSGDGGDELFAGYTHYFKMAATYRWLQRVPLALRKSVARGLEAWTSSPRTGHWLDALAPQPAPGSEADRPRYKLQKLSEVLRLDTPADLYLWSASRWRKPLDLVRGGAELPTVFDRLNGSGPTDDFIHFMMLVDTQAYLPDDILTKLDRASMAVSLEARVPLLDHRVVEYAWRLPLRFKVRNRQGKWILRQVLYRYVPPHLVERPKQGFSLPLAQWLRGPLRDWAESMLDERRLQEEGFFNPFPIRDRWNAHQTRQRNSLSSLWNVLMFQAWQERWIKNRKLQVRLP